MPVPDFSPGEVLTAAAMDSIGLWLVKTQVLSGTSTQIDNCFTSNFDSYKVIFSNLNVSTADVLTFRLIEGTTPNITSNYYSSRIGITAAGAVTSGSSAGVSFWSPFYVGTNSAASGASVDVFNPKLSVATSFSGVGVDPRTGGDFYRASGGWFNGTNSFDGLWVSSLNGGYTLSGTVRVYGYRN